MTISNLKLRGTITVEGEVGDFLEAAKWQEKLQNYLDSIRDEFPSASMFIAKRRKSTANGDGQIRIVTRPSSGRLNSYE